MDPDKLAAARARQACGESPTQIAKALGVSRASVYRHLGTEAQKGLGQAHVRRSGQIAPKISRHLPSKVTC